MLATTKLMKDYLTNDSRLPVLANINLEVHRNELIAIIGPNGCGKSTLLRLLAGLERPSGGKVLLNGKEVQRPTRDIAMMFQTPALLPWLSVFEHLKLPYNLTGDKSSLTEDELIGILRTTGLHQFASSRPQHLSVGMRQMLAFCMALSVGSKILLMDEPFSALNAITREQLAVLLLRVLLDIELTIVLVTHNISEAVFLADRVIVLTSRPCYILKSVKIPFERPRSLSLLSSNTFNIICSDLRSVLLSVHNQ